MNTIKPKDVFWDIIEKYVIKELSKGPNPNDLGAIPDIIEALATIKTAEIAIDVALLSLGASSAHMSDPSPYETIRNLIDEGI